MRVFTNNSNCNAKYGHIHSWSDLAPILGLRTNMLAYAKIARHRLQKRVPIPKENGKIRWTFKSLSPLSKIQVRIGQMCAEMFETLDNTECAIAYRKGVRYTDAIKELRPARHLIQFDIKGYFDHVTLEHIVEVLKKQGLPHAGATMIGLYCTRYAHGGVQTLQQGSAASPAISNLVGHYAFDLPIRKWLSDNYPQLDCTYVRFCDNLALFVHDAQPEGFYQEFRAFCEKNCEEHGFKSQKWNCISDDNPAIHQKFLGMIVNSTPRVERESLDKIRAQLFNWCCNGLTEEATKNADMEGIDNIGFAAPELLRDHYKRKLNGHINYINTINSEHGTMLRKLLCCAKMLDEKHSCKRNRVKQGSELFNAIKKYRDKKESVDDYVERIDGISYLESAYM